MTNEEKIRVAELLDLKRRCDTMAGRRKADAELATYVQCMLDHITALESALKQERINHEAEVRRLLEWVSDLQSGMYINCVYCGHRYGPKESTPVSMADVLKAHVEQCPQHPMSILKQSHAAEVKQAFYEAYAHALLDSTCPPCNVDRAWGRSNAKRKLDIPVPGEKP